MAVMYVWTKDEESWGHASLSLDDSDSYISWWPKDDKSKNSMKKKKTGGITKDRLPLNYDDEKEYFTGRIATHVFKISSRILNTGKIRSWWEQMEKGGYHFLLNNCCDLVVKALREGELSIDGALIRTPADMVNLGKELEKK